MDSPVNYDASPPRDAGCWNDDPEGTSDHPMPGNQVRRGSEQPDRGCWMPWGSGAEKTGVKSALMTNVHRGHAHQLEQIVIQPAHITNNGEVLF